MNIAMLARVMVLVLVKCATGDHTADPSKNFGTLTNGGPSLE